MRHLLPLDTYGASIAAGLLADGRFRWNREGIRMLLARSSFPPRTVIASAMLVIATAFATPARADIVSLARLVAIVNASPPLHARSDAGRYGVSLHADGDAVGFLDASIVDYGFQSDNRDVLIVPLPSGGSGGVFTTLLFTNLVKRPVYAGKLESNGHLDVHLARGRIEARTPVYGPNDPQCCPSGHRTVRYRLQGSTLVKIDEFPS